MKFKVIIPILILSISISSAGVFSPDTNEVGRYQLHMGSDPITKGFIIDTKTGAMYTIVMTRDNLRKAEGNKAYVPKFTPYPAYTYKGKNYMTPLDIANDTSSR